MLRLNSAQVIVNTGIHLEVQSTPSDASNCVLHNHKFSSFIESSFKESGNCSCDLQH
jgi:hypothetical protein